MKRYCVKCLVGRIEYFDVISENNEGYEIRLTRLSDGNERIIYEFMSRHLFDICIRAGYIYQLENAVVSVA